MSLYGKFYLSFLYPFYESTLKGRKTFDYYRFLEKSQWYPQEQLLEYQLGELQNLLAHAYDQTAYYRRVFDDLDAKPQDIKSLEDFARLPILDKQLIREHGPDMVARDHVGRTINKSTGGSTGEPLRFEYTHLSYEWRMAIRMRGYGWSGCRDGEKTAYIWGAAIDEPTFKQRIKEGIDNGLRRWKYFNCFHLDPQMVRDVGKALHRFSPNAIVGYATPTYNLALSAREQGVSMPRVKAVVTAAERVQDYQREVIEEVFGCKVYSTYGSREFMLVASECEAHNGMHVNVENIVAEIVHDDARLDPNGPGELVITDLHNFGMPFIRYKIGDLGVPSKVTECPCGRGLPMIRDVEGRLLDTILTKEGKMVPGEFFPHLAKEFEGIRRFQVTQNEIDRLIIKIVPNGQFEGDPLQRFKDEIVKVVGPTTQLDIQFVDDIPLTATGKFRVTVSNVWQDGPA